MSDFNYPGQFSSVAIMKYTPSTTYLAADVYDQEITIMYDTSAITPTGVFWVSTNNNWVELSSTMTSSGSDGTIMIDMDVDSQVLAQGEIVLMGGELQGTSSNSSPNRTNCIGSEGWNNCRILVCYR